MYRLQLLVKSIQLCNIEVSLAALTRLLFIEYLLADPDADYFNTDSDWNYSIADCIESGWLEIN